MIGLLGCIQFDQKEKRERERKKKEDKVDERVIGLLKGLLTKGRCIGAVHLSSDRHREGKKGSRTDQTTLTSARRLVRIFKFGTKR